MRKTFELERTDYAMLRMVVYTRQGYRIYLNGKLVSESEARSKNWQPKYIYFDKNMHNQLKTGRNVLAATSFMQYFKGKEGDIEVYIEAIDEIPPSE